MRRDGDLHWEVYCPSRFPVRRRLYTVAWVCFPRGRGASQGVTQPAPHVDLFRLVPLDERLLLHEKPHKLISRKARREKCEAATRAGHWIPAKKKMADCLLDSSS